MYNTSYNAPYYCYCKSRPYNRGHYHYTFHYSSSYKQQSKNNRKKLSYSEYPLLIFIIYYFLIRYQYLYNPLTTTYDYIPQCKMVQIYEFHNHYVIINLI